MTRRHPARGQDRPVTARGQATRSAFRVAARLVVIMLLDAVALFVLADILAGFDLTGAAAAMALAVVLAVGNAVVWPFIVRVALPFTVLTLGLGALKIGRAHV